MKNTLTKWKYDYLWSIVEELNFFGEAGIDDPAFDILDELDETLSRSLSSRLYDAVYEVMEYTVKKISEDTTVKIQIE